MINPNTVEEEGRSRDRGAEEVVGGVERRDLELELARERRQGEPEQGESERPAGE
jgi:hypothetical protein